MKHIYPPGSFKPLTGIGAVAYCGHVKDTPWNGETWNGDTAPDRCTECVDRVMEPEEAA